MFSPCESGLPVASPPVGAFDQATGLELVLVPGHRIVAPQGRVKIQRRNFTIFFFMKVKKLMMFSYFHLCVCLGCSSHSPKNMTDKRSGSL